MSFLVGRAHGQYKGPGGALGGWRQVLGLGVDTFVVFGFVGSFTVEVFVLRCGLLRKLCVAIRFADGVNRLLVRFCAEEQ